MVKPQLVGELVIVERGSGAALHKLRLQLAVRSHVLELRVRKPVVRGRRTANRKQRIVVACASRARVVVVVVVCVVVRLPSERLLERV